jgi:hypothetical protein
MKRNTIVNDRYPHTIRIVRRNYGLEDINPFVRASAEVVETEIYNGVGRAYTDTTTDGDSKVDTNKRKASIPMRFDRWTTEGEEPMWPLDGDIIEAVMGNVTEVGRVKDFEPDNDRSIVYWEFVRG